MNTERNMKSARMIGALISEENGPESKVVLWSQHGCLERTQALFN